MSGFVTLYRSILDWEWYTDLPTKAVFIHCVLKANYEDCNWRGTELKRGQFITSIQKLASETGLSDRQTRTALSKLESTSEVTIKTTNKFSIVTVCNYDSYQSKKDDSDKQNDKQNVKQKSNKRQAECQTNDTHSDKQSTTDNNITIKQDNKEQLSPLTPQGEEVEKSKSKKFIKPTIEQVSEYCTQRNNGLDAEAFFYHYESKGWKVGNSPMKDWKASVVTWEKKRKENPQGYSNFQKQLPPKSANHTIDQETADYYKEKLGF